MNEELRREALGFARSYKISVLVTVNKDCPSARFMEHFNIDDDFNIWYTTGASSDKIRQIKSDSNVCVLMLKEGKDIRIFGKAEVLDDKETKHSCWEDSWSAYFPGGVDDPEYIIVKVTPKKIEYRDRQKHGHTPQIM